MADPPLLPKRVSGHLVAITIELAEILERYRQITPFGDAHSYVIGDVVRMHEHVWDAVALLREALPIPASQATLLAHIYHTRRSEHSGAVSLDGLAEIIELLQMIVVSQRCDFLDELALHRKDASGVAICQTGAEPPR